MESILVTVIIPVYNTEKYIEDCMKSVLKQSHQNLEIILINDGSTDSSADVCRRFTSDNRVVFIDRENWGLSRTRQQGIDMAHGMYFCNLDSDDAQEPRFIEKMLIAAHQTGADMVTCGRKDFDVDYEQDCLLSADASFYPVTAKVVSQRFYELSANLWFADSWNKLYRTEFVRESGVRYWLENKYNGTDLSFNHLLLLHCPKVAVVNEPLLLHRIVQGSRVHRKNKPLLEGFQCIATRQIEEAKAQGYGDDFFEGYKYIYYMFLKMAMSAIVAESENKKELKTRWESYRCLVSGFAVQYPALSPKKLKGKKCYGFDRIMNSAILSSHYLSCLGAYELNRLRRFCSKKAGK